MITIALPHLAIQFSSSCFVACNLNQRWNASEHGHTRREEKTGFATDSARPVIYSFQNSSRVNGIRTVIRRNKERELQFGVTWLNGVEVDKNNGRGEKEEEQEEGSRHRERRTTT
jgi:hypothetical protein